MSEQGRPVRTVGVMGSETTAVTDALGDAGVDLLEGSPSSVLDADPDVVVAAGETALIRLARERPSCPIVAVDAGPGVRSVPKSALDRAVTQLTAGDWTTDGHPLVAVEVGDDRVETALFDAMVVTERPAHISEFSVAVEGEQVARFRADGVVAATPAGTPGYARAAGAPIVPPGPDVLALAAVAPFSTDLDHWVLPLSEVEITVERDEATVDTLVDDRTVAPAPGDRPVRLTRAGEIDVVRLPTGVSPFSRQDAELENF